MIVHLASEVAPFYKRGGLGDVLGTLPNYLSKNQPNTVISFYYKNRMKGDDLKFMGSFDIKIQNIYYEFYYYHINQSGVDYYFINMSDSNIFSDMETSESDSSDEDGEMPYKENFPYIIYFYFAKAAIQLIQNLNLSPELILFHDWHVCGCLAYTEDIKKLNVKKTCKTVVLIHNYEFQGEILPDLLDFLDPEVKTELDSIYKQYGTATFFALAFKNADYVATVSKTYAQELIQKSAPHSGLKFLDLIEKDIFSLPNGIDDVHWSPEFSPYLQYHYNKSTYKEKKKENKQELIKEMQFDDASKPVVLMMARLTEQKGINLLVDLWSSEDIAMDSIENILNQDVNLIVYGRPAGGLNGNIHKRLAKAGEKFKGRFSYIPTYTEEKAHRFLAGSDMILCPSLFEPCGLVQLYGLAFGTIPVVRPVGGLKDTVIPHTESSELSTGFYIDEFKNESLKNAIREASDIYYHQKDNWDALIERAMSQSFSWDITVDQYYNFFEYIQENKKEHESKINYREIMI